MQTVEDMYKALAGIDGEGAANFQEIAIRVCEKDGLAGKMLLWLAENLPAEATNGDAMDIIDTAKFWLMFIGATAEKVTPKNEHLEEDDGWTISEHHCATCGGKLEAVRPGKWQCPNCK